MHNLIWRGENEVGDDSNLLLGGTSY